MVRGVACCRSPFALLPNPRLPQNGFTALHLASQNGSRRCVESLARAPGASLDAAAALGNSPLHIAAIEDQLDSVETLLDCGAAIDSLNAYARTPLLVAAAAGRVDAAELLIVRGADVSAGDADGSGPLHLAAAAGHVECVEMLLARGLPRGATDKVSA